MQTTNIQKSAHVTKTYNRKQRTGRTPQLTEIPKIQLTGNWLKNLGFAIGETLTIIATAGVITIKKGE